MIIIEAEHTLKEAVVFVSRTSSTTQPTLDLRMVAAQTRNEIRAQKTEEVTHNKEKNHSDTKSEADILSLMDDTNKTTKETDKYTALVPTTGKSKKKLSKKNGTEFTTADVQKKCCKAKCNEKHSNDHDNQKKHDLKEHKKPTHLKKISEEETSSTTTESSNNDEPEKDSKATGKKSPVSKVSVNLKVPLNNEVGGKLDFKRTARKIVQKQKDKEQEQKEVKTIVDNNKIMKGTKIFVKDRKDKQPLVKKFSVDKKVDNINTSVRLSPTFQFNSVWGENRATFSDVVARSDNVTLRQPLTQTQNQINKPTMYVEPYKQSSIDLGPIGSKKNDFHQESHVRNSQDQFNEISNSFFSDSHNLGLENSNSFLNFGDNWEQRNSSSQLLSLMQSSSSGCSSTAGSMSDSWGQSSQNADANNGYWDSTHNLLNENVPTSLANPGCSYLWGSSSVWQPWAPAERTPTRTPPGFSSNREIDERMQHNQAYDLFGMTNIWAQQYPNPWNYPQSQ